MKLLKVFLLSVLLLSVNRLYANDSFCINGLVKNASDTTYIVYDCWIPDGNMVSDSVMVVQGKFLITGKIVGGIAKIWLYHKENEQCSFLIEPTQMDLIINADDFSDYELRGLSPELENEIAICDKAFHKLDSKDRVTAKHLVKIGDELTELRKNSEENTVKIDSLEHLFFSTIALRRKLSNKYAELCLEFVKKHSDFRIAPFYVPIDNDEYRQETFELFEQLPLEIKNRPEWGVVKQGIAKVKAQLLEEGKSQPGAKAPDFERTTFLGDSLRLSDYQGKKYVLLDFWASWCGPCIKGIPKLKELYETYKDLGLEIIGLSVDADPNKWKAAIEQQQIASWPQALSDDWQLESGEKRFSERVYHIEGVPTYILIDKDGIIVGRWNRLGEEVEKLLKDILQKEK